MIRTLCATVLCAISFGIALATTPSFLIPRWQSDLKSKPELVNLHSMESGQYYYNKARAASCETLRRCVKIT